MPPAARSRWHSELEVVRKILKKIQKRRGLMMVNHNLDADEVFTLIRAGKWTEIDRRMTPVELSTATEAVGLQKSDATDATAATADHQFAECRDSSTMERLGKNNRQESPPRRIFKRRGKCLR